MKRTLYEQDIKEVLYGAAFLGSGGGGPLKIALEMLAELKNKTEKVELELLDLDDMEAEDYACTVVCVGSPLAMLKDGLGPGGQIAFEAYQETCQVNGKNLKCLYSVEMGGFNTFVPIMVDILSDPNPKNRLPFLDIDGNGRAVPEACTTLGCGRGYVPDLMTFGSDDGDKIIAYPSSQNAAEEIARHLCMAFGMRLGLSSSGMDREELRDRTVPAGITMAQNIGRALLRCQSEHKDVLSELTKVMEVRQACRGKITELQIAAEGGFDKGMTTVSGDDGKTYYIEFENENLLIRDDSGKVHLTAPELICFVSADTCEPLTNAETKEGMEILVLLAPAYHQWWNEDKGAYHVWDHLLENLGYTGPMVRY